MTELQRYHVLTEDLPILFGRDPRWHKQPLTALYLSTEVEAALAAKDARIRDLELSQAHLMDRLDQINIWANEERNNHGDSRKLAQIIDWSGGYAKLPHDLNASPGENNGTV